jgi:hypothetical protein
MFDNFMAHTLAFEPAYIHSQHAQAYLSALKQCRLGIKQGGLGLTSATLAAPAAGQTVKYVATVEATVGERVARHTVLHLPVFCSRIFQGVAPQPNAAARDVERAACLGGDIEGALALFSMATNMWLATAFDERSVRSSSQMTDRVPFRSPLGADVLDLQPCNEQPRLYGACTVDMNEGFHPGGKKTDWQFFVKASPRDALMAAIDPVRCDEATRNAVARVWPHDATPERRAAVVNLFEETLLWKPASVSCMERSRRAEAAAALRRRAIITAAFDAVFGPDTYRIGHNEYPNPARKWHYAPKPLPPMIINDPLHRIDNKLAVVVEYRDQDMQILASDDSYPAQIRGPGFTRAYAYLEANVQRCLNRLADPAEVQCSRIFSRVQDVTDLDAPPADASAAVRHAINLLTQSPHFLDFYGPTARPLYCEAMNTDGRAEAEAMITQATRLANQIKSAQTFVAVAAEAIAATNANGNVNQQQQQQPPQPQQQPALANQGLPVANQQPQPPPVVGQGHGGNRAAGAPVHDVANNNNNNNH